MTFTDYFSVNEDVETILNSFGYSYLTRILTLPQHVEPLDFVEPFRERLLKVIPQITLLGEASRREFLIAPVLTELVVQYNVRIRPEFSLKVSPLLQGNIDYLVQAGRRIIVVEAKQSDLQRGFRQMAVEMIAVDQGLATLEDEPLLWGVVTSGEVWRFAVLNRTNREMVLDIEQLRVPRDLEQLFRTLIAILLDDLVRK